MLMEKQSCRNETELLEVAWCTNKRNIIIIIIVTDNKKEKKR